MLSQFEPRSFFPRDFLKKQGVDRLLVNFVLNTTIIERQKNVRIGKKAPSVYVPQLKRKKINFDEILKTHLIDNVEFYGILKDKYKQLLAKRGLKILEELNKRLPKAERNQTE